MADDRGAPEAAVADVAGNLVGERSHHRALGIAPRRLAGEAGHLDEMVAVAADGSDGRVPNAPAGGETGDQDHVRALAAHIDREPSRLELCRGRDRRHRQRSRGAESECEAGDDEAATIHGGSLTRPA